ncbi:MAG: hypothetical protein HEEMFOPI_01864 [Holosporales bacterium]
MQLILENLVHHLLLKISEQALINTASNIKPYSRFCINIANIFYFFIFCSVVNALKAEHVPNVMLSIAGGFSIKAIDPVFKGFDFSLELDTIRSCYRPYLSDSIKRYYLSDILTCFFVRRGITETSSIQKKMRHLFLNSKNFESLKTMLIDELNFRCFF